MLRNFFQKNKKILGIATLVIFFAVSPFGFHVANAWGFCSATGACAAFATVFADLLMIPMIFAGWILWVGGVLLNAVLDYTVVHLTTNINGITGINIAWATIRDLANMLFIFILLYLAIGTILEIEGVNWKKGLVSVIIAAVLINFSLFFTKIIIDVSNIATLGFYQQIVPGASVTQGLSDSIMKPLGLTTLWNPATGSDLLKQFSGSLSTIAIVSVGSSVFMVITAFTFLAVAIMFLIRYITIVLLLILSPLALMGSVLPRLKQQADKWWKRLYGAALFAPIYMIMVWVVLTIIGNGGFLCKGPSGTATTQLSGLFTSVAQGQNGTSTLAVGSCPAGSFSLMINFIIIIGFIIEALVLSRELSEQAGSGAQKLVSRALGAGAGAVAYTSRKSLGSAGRAMADSESLKERANKKGIQGTIARLGLRTGQTAAKGSYDIRSSGIDTVSKELGMGELGIGGKAGGKGGYDAYIKEKAKQEKEAGESLKPSDIVVDQAKQRLESLKEVKPNDPKFIEQHRKAVAEKQAIVTQDEQKLRQAEREYTTSRSSMTGTARTEKEEQIKNLTEKVGKSRTAVSEIGNPTEYAAKINTPERAAAREQAQTEVDNLAGVDEKTAKQRVEKKIKADIRTSNPTMTTEEVDTEFKKRSKEPAYLAEVEATKKKGAGTERKEAYAETISGRSGLGRIIPDTSRVLLFGKVKRQNKQAAADLRKDKKPVKDQLEQILRDQGDIPPAGEEGGAGAPTDTSGTPTPPSAPSPAPRTPPAASTP